MGDTVGHLVQHLDRVAGGDDDRGPLLLLKVAGDLALGEAAEQLHDDLLVPLLARGGAALLLARPQLQDVELRLRGPVRQAGDEVRGGAQRQPGGAGHVGHDLGHGHSGLPHPISERLCRVLDILWRLALGLVESDQHDAGGGQAWVEALQVGGLRDDGGQRDLLRRHLLQAGGNDALSVLLICQLPVSRPALVHIVIGRCLRADDPRGALHVVHHARLLEALRHVREEGLQDEEAHLGEGGQRLVAVVPLVQVHLPDGVRPKDPRELQEQLRLDAVLHHEGQPLQVLPPTAKLSAERLDDVVELRVVEVDERAGEQLRDPATDAGALAVARAQGPLVEGLDVAALGVGEQRPDQADDEDLGEVGDVGVAPAADVPRAAEEGLPELHALAPVLPVGQDLRGQDDPGAVGLRDLDGPVLGVAVDDDDLVQQPLADVVDDLQDVADGLLLLKRGEDERHRDAHLLLALPQLLEVPEEVLGVEDPRVAGPALGDAPRPALDLGRARHAAPGGGLVVDAVQDHAHGLDPALGTHALDARAGVRGVRRVAVAPVRPAHEEGPVGGLQHGAVVLGVAEADDGDGLKLDLQQTPQ
mmetsp:Transcript_37160/g.115627  ORF Transcript_37160/g.115627 Transcript_37160/m.115627 type:complete len:588 (-) Transcript_37160:703-2466(-)